MGGAVKNIISGIKNTVSGQIDAVKDGDWNEVLRHPGDINSFVLDPGGLVLQNPNEGIAQVQSGADIGNIGANPAQAAVAAEDAAKEQERLIAEQQALVDAEAAKQKKITEERTIRMKQNQLLSGSETGLSSSGRTTLLG